MRFIGVDPGDRWVGIALLEIRGVNWKAESRVLDVSARSSMLELVEDILNWIPAKIIAEDYRVRPVGHQAFTGGYTLRLLGALEIYTAMKLGTWITMLPGPAMDLDMLHLGRFIRPSYHTPSPGGHWRHAFSAWRVLGRHLMMEEKQFLERLRLTKTNSAMIRGLLSPRPRRSTNDLFSPLITWKTV